MVEETNTRTAADRHMHAVGQPLGGSTSTESSGTVSHVRRWLPRALLAIGYLSFCLAVQWASGAWGAGYTTYPDEPSHMVGAVMVHDWILSGQWLSPYRFASEYYSHYPFFAVGYWPPLHHAVTALVFLLLGVGRTQALLVPAIFAAGTAFLIFCMVRRRASTIAAVSAGLLFLSLPVSQLWMCAIMVDHVTTFFCVAACFYAIRYFEAATWLNAILCAVACACGTLSKYNAVYAAAIPFIAALMLRRTGLWRKASFYVQPLIVVMLAGPWILWAWSMHLMFYAFPPEKPAMTLSRVTAYTAVSFSNLTISLIVVVVIGLIILVARRARWGADLAVVILFYAAHIAVVVSAPVNPEGRHFLAPTAFLLILAFWGYAGLISTEARVAWWPMLAPTLAVAASVAFSAYWFGRYPKQPPSPFAPLVDAVLRNPAWSGARILVPVQWKGSVIAEFVARSAQRPSHYLVRPSKLLASMNWMGGEYSLAAKTPEQALEMLRREHIGLVMWCAPDRVRFPHERILVDTHQQYGSGWRNSGTFASRRGILTECAIYELPWFAGRR